ncbi:peroxidase [Acrocarpospora phusangensis]|uniref:Peroxidase n=1 Tax=Acrocarpospora phusangensis TaxID=1070424 RepID=A0A919QAS1_9ACTN|nr:Dyp-type peroxidase [Acrocarpospora phusangensis]GIH23953.1 peroxidase [Acrocarpospora phusangensis]
MADPRDEPGPRPGVRLTRRGLFAGGAVAAAGAVAGTAMAMTRAPETVPAASPAAVPVLGAAVEPFHGVRQAGIATPAQAHAVFAAFDLRAGADRDGLARLMRLLTDDARRLTQGRAALADTEPELAALPARLTVTFGFGPGLFKAAGLPAPVEPLPAFSIDRLQERWNGGDLLAQICADDPLTVSHALRMIVKDARSFATVRWTQRGFRRAAHTQEPTHTQRNVMGQLDGTVNPVPGDADFERAVWSGDGTTLVLRRIHTDMETWDAADTVAKEFTIGRRLSDGAPLTGSREHDEPDFERLTPAGFPVISEYAHIRRARVEDPNLRILRRVYNYDDGLAQDGVPDTGLLFASYQADVARQFVPLQRRLAEADLLNEWTTPIGSAVFHIPPGCGPGGWIGEALLA